ncbi:Flp pilus assembly protein CpaB [Thioalkalivibrio nitratireducens DSM 14787]|uniref:Flp pilus assembly protein CpaB n=1 Tax=Thioalkalivibrio nitratireducens (strain DSM 14787 / UNIQEM 213 / ALEN2) TaxID=1255043 RepID=L0E0I1_THIND|nr:Flp pilus assembly protein CpaB [Thioalkalivibrio nitratireducens]AGA34146.1 Flp pilus assembly protein CpaB [Thioalkalivibrio nitratireducens DSM 14787]
MNSRLMTVVAILLLGAAVIAGIAGYQLSRQPEPVAAPPAEPAPPPEPTVEDDARVEVLFAARDLQAGARVGPDDLRVERLSVRPPHAFSEPDAVIGKLLVLPVREGEPLLDTRFFKASQLARTLRPGERALAVAVDDVVGAGGYIAPGDHVDLLLYLKETGARAGPARESAQVVVSDLRVLSYELRLDLPPDGAAEDTDGERDGQRRSNRTAVLAVPEDEAPKVMLAANAGSLRLALHGADERLAVAAADVDVDPGPVDEAAAPVVGLGTLMPRPVAEEPLRFTTIDALLPPAVSPPPDPARRPAPEPRPGVILHRGTQSVEIQP